MASGLGRDRSKIMNKCLKGCDSIFNSAVLESLESKNAKFLNLEVIGGIQDLQLFNVEIFDSVIENTVIGGNDPGPGTFTTLQTGGPGGTGYNVCFYGSTIGEFSCWDATRGQWEISGELSVTQESTLGNIGIAANTISSVNTNGDVNIDPNGFGTVRIEGPVSQHADIGDFLVDLDNGLININSSGDITLNSSQGTGTFSANDGLNLTTTNGDICLRTEIATTQNITTIDNTGGLLRIVTSAEHNLNVGDTITLASTNSDPIVDGNYTVGNLINTTSFIIFGNVTTDGTTGNLFKELSNIIKLDPAVRVEIPENIPLTFGDTCNSISGNTGAMTITTCGDLELDVPSTNSIFVMNADTKLQFTTSGTNYLTYDSINAELDLTTAQLHVTSTTNLFEVTNVKYTDPILTVGGLEPLTTDDNKDRGIEFYYHTGTEARLGWFGYKDNTGRFTFIPNATNNNEVITGDIGDFEYNTLFVNDVVILNSSGSVDLSCGDIINVSNLQGCDGDLTISGSANVTIDATNSFVVNTTAFNLPNNVPLNFGTCGSSIIENTSSNLVITGCENIEIQTTENGAVSLPANSLLTFTGSTDGSQSISADTAGNITILADQNINLTTTGGSINIPDDTHINLGPGGTEYITGNTTSGIEMCSNQDILLCARDEIQLQSTTGDILLNVLNNTNTVRIPTNVRLVFDLANTENSIYTESSGNLIITGKTSGNIQLENTDSINLYASTYVKLNDNTQLTFEDDLSSYITSNNNTFLITNSENSTEGILKLTANTTELHNTSGTLNIVNDTTNITSNNLLATIGNVSIEGISTMTLNGHTAGSEFLTCTTHVRHKDPIVTLAYDTHTSNDGKDRGIEYEYYDTTAATEKLGWFGWKNTTGKFTFYSEAVNNDEVISGTFGSIELANIFINQDITFVSAGSLDLNCGDVINVANIYGCMGDLTIHASNNATVSAGTLNLMVDNSIDVTPNTPMNFGGTDNSISGDTGGILTLKAGNKIIIDADLQVLGTRTEIESTVGSLVDPVFTLGGTSPPTVDDNKDRGIAFHYHTGTEARLGYFGFDDTDYKWKYLVEATNANEVLTGVYGDIVVNDICAENIALNVNSTSGGTVTGLTQLSGGDISISSTNGPITITPTSGQPILLPFENQLAFGDTTNTISVDTAGNMKIYAHSLGICTTEEITLDSQTGIRIPEGVPLYFGDSPDTTTYIIKDTSNNLEIFNSEGNILLTPSSTINSSSGHVVIPENNPITFCDYNNRIESDCNELKLFGYTGISLNNTTTINGNLNIIGTLTASSQSLDLNEFILPLGTFQFLNITSAVNGPSAGEVDITTSIDHNLVAGDTVTLTNLDSDPVIDGTYTVASVVDSDTIRINAVTLTTPGTTGELKSNLISDPGKDVGIQVNWHNGTTTGTADAEFGFFGFKRDTLKWTFYERGVNTNDVFTGTLGNIELDKACVSRMSGFTLEGTLNAGAQTVFGSNFNIDGGTIDNTAIGGTIASTGRFTTLTSTIQANLEDVTLAGNLNYSCERFTVSSGLPIRNPLVNTVVSFINVSGVSFNSTGNTMADGTVDCQLKKLVVESMGTNCQYDLSFTAGKLVAPDPKAAGDATLIRFKRKGQSVDLLWSVSLSAWILCSGGAYITQ